MTKSKPNTVHLLLVYSLSARKLIETKMFQGDDGSSEAIESYMAAEKEHLRDRDTEIVLVGATDFETIATTHGSYWEADISALLDRLEKLATPQ